MSNKKSFVEKFFDNIIRSWWKGTVVSIFVSVLLISAIEVSSTGQLTPRPLLVTIAISATVGFVASVVMRHYHLVIVRKNAELKAMTEELEAFNRMAAHDLKDPISTVTGYVTLLQEEMFELSDFERELLDKIAEGTYKMATIIDDLLLLAQAGNEDVEVQSLDMKPLIEQAWARHTGLIKQHNPTLEIAKDLPAAMGYAPWVEAVWSNYLSNAIKYGGRPPRVRVGVRVLPNKQVQYWIKDNGKGLSVDDQAQLFTEFSQTPRIQGHGLGLSIVQRIVKHLGGEVGILDSTSNGTIFYFTLPTER